MAYRTEEEWIKFEKEAIAKLPTFGRLEEALAFAIEKASDIDYHAFILREPNNKNYVVADCEYLEVLGNHDYTMLFTSVDIYDLAKEAERRNHGR